MTAVRSTDESTVRTTTSYWAPGDREPVFAPGDITAVAGRVREPVVIVTGRSGHGVGSAIGGGLSATPTDHEVLGLLPPLYPEWLGDPSFRAAHGVRFPY